MMGNRIVDLGRRFYRLERGDRGLVVEAVVLVGLAQAGLRTVSFVSLRRMFDAAKRVRSRSKVSTTRIAWAIGAAAQVLPHRTCLKDALAADVRELAHLERRLDLYVLRREILGGFVGEEQRDLVDELAEVDGRRVLVAQVGELVLDERMLDLDDLPRMRLGHRHCARYVVQPRKPG